ncbi:hypothetical protein GCM10017687_43490 [Streptomyces echinatus]
MIDERGLTSVPGLWAAGNASGFAEQVVNAASRGYRAGAGHQRGAAHGRPGRKGLLRDSRAGLSPTGTRTSQETRDGARRAAAPQAGTRTPAKDTAPSGMRLPPTDASGTAPVARLPQARTRTPDERGTVRARLPPLARDRPVPGCRPLARGRPRCGRAAGHADPRGKEGARPAEP